MRSGPVTGFCRRAVWLLVMAIVITACGGGGDHPLFRHAMYQQSEKLRDNVHRSEGQPMAVAVSPMFCPHYTYTAWGRGRDNARHAVFMCGQEVAVRMQDYPADEINRCQCSVAVHNHRAVMVDLLNKN